MSLEKIFSHLLSLGLAFGKINNSRTWSFGHCTFFRKGLVFPKFLLFRVEKDAISLRDEIQSQSWPNQEGSSDLTLILEELLL